ncbi:MAG: hypothetical protein QXV22_03250, partial [Thermoplasmataceae archaeon]
DEFPVMVTSSDLYIHDKTVFKEISDAYRNSNADLINIVSGGSPSGISVFRRRPLENEEMQFANMTIRSPIININTPERLQEAINLEKSKK